MVVEIVRGPFIEDHSDGLGFALVGEGVREGGLKQVGVELGDFVRAPAIFLCDIDNAAFKPLRMSENYYALGQCLERLDP